MFIKMMMNNCINCFIFNNNYSSIIELVLSNYLLHQVFCINFNFLFYRVHIMVEVLIFITVSATLFGTW